MSKIVEFFTPEGEVTQYRPLSARLPTFLAVYGPERGFSVDTEIVDSLSLKPGLLKLYEIVLHAGRKPEEAGLPPLNGTGQTLVGRATLRDREGRVLATATAAKPIQSYKDLEVLETAARQRLLAALGFGGEVLDTDEILDQTDQGWVSRPIVPAVPATRAVGATPIVPPPSIQDTAGTPASIQDAAEAPASSQDAPVAEVAEGVMPLAVAAGIPPVASPPAAPAPVAAPPVSDRDARALTALIRQIEQQARVRGIEPPVVTTRQEAQVALQRLLRHV
ncbi:MAG: hypothetical protein CTR54_23005 [Rhizobium sp.]|nr:MAG: hypothetical protein CTR54_23005 [Rhizobium sp.]